jgi:hypothetical protein
MSTETEVCCWGLKSAKHLCTNLCNIINPRNDNLKCQDIEGNVSGIAYVLEIGYPEFKY